MQEKKKVSEVAEKMDLVLPPEVQKYLDELVSDFIATEKEEYNNDLVPFSQHAEQMKIKGKEVVTDLYKQLQNAQKILRKEFELEEKQNPNIDSEAKFSHWEERSQLNLEKMRKPNYSPQELTEVSSLQESGGISWAFMDRAYNTGRHLIEEKRFEDAKDVFLFLRYLNPTVFEYWMYEAICLHELGKFEDAFESYCVSLTLKPKNPFVFFQLANCLYELGEIESSIKAMDICIEYGLEEGNQNELVKEAQEIKHNLELQKVA